MKPYQQPFWITEARGNNAFSYEQRGAQPRLYVPALQEGSLEDVALGDEVVFEDVDEYGVLQSCRGLKTLLHTQWEGIPVVVMDNHNHAFYFWWELLQGREPATLIHVDQHKDMRAPEKMFNGETAEDAFFYTHLDLNVGNYIVPAREAGWIRDIHFVTSETSLEEDFVIPEGPLLLNVDLDFFAPELGYISFDKAREKIRVWGRRASLITVATSPFFIEQKRALDFLKRLFGGAVPPTPSTPEPSKVERGGC